MKISVLLFAGFAIILVLFSITTFVNYRQTQEVQEDTEWVATSQIIIRNSARLQRNIVEMESSLRGFLFTRDTTFLQAYQLSEVESQEIYTELRSLKSDNSHQLKKLEKIIELNEQWKKNVAQPLTIARLNDRKLDSSHQEFRHLYESRVNNRAEQNINLQTRDLFKEFNNAEYELRAIRRKKLNDSAMGTRQISFTLTTLSLLIGFFVVMYVNRVISRRIRTMVDLADRIAHGDFNTPIDDSSEDELSKLSRSLDQMAKTLAGNINELERKNKELDRFAYVVSHDLKAPLRGIENISLWLEEDFGSKLSAEASKYLGMLRGRINRMERLIDGILKLSRIGKEKKILEDVNVRTMLHEIMEMLSPQPTVELNISSFMPVFRTEKVPLQQVLSNLLSNAIKHHHREKVVISIDCKQTHQHYVFSVSDNGPGIEPEYHEKIFIIFQTLKERDALESTGVGLTIVKKILDDRNCPIWIESAPFEGTTFFFNWPKSIQ